jgi:hypothetical protein
MTAPFAPPPSRTTLIILIGLVAAALAAPFARRENAMGWFAF